MKKLKAIMCLLLALTIFIGSNMTTLAYSDASDYVQDLTTFEKNLRIYFIPTNKFESYGDGRYQKYDVRRIETSETVYMGFFRDIRLDLDYKYCNLVLITEKQGVKYGSYVNSCQTDEELQEALSADIELDSELKTSVVIDGKTYYYTTFTMSLMGNDSMNLGLWVFPALTGSGDPRNYQELFGSDDVPAEWEDGVKPLPERDEDYQFVNFKSDEWVRASWDGTTYDDKASEYDSMSYEVRLCYARVGGRADDIQEEEVLTTDGILSSGTWSKKYSLLTHENDGLYLRYVKFTPLLKKGGFTCRGKTEIQSFTEDGSDDPREDKLTYKKVDDFYLIGVTVENSNLGIIDGNVRSHVSWVGTSYDDLVSRVPLDKTDANISILCYDKNMKAVFKDISELDSDFMGGEPLRLRRALDDSTQSFYINTTKIYDTAQSMGLTFSGDVYIAPIFYYEPHNVIYQGKETIIDVYKDVIEQDPEPTPMPLPSPTPDDGDGFLPDDDDLTPDNALEWVWKVLKNLYKQLGQFPQLMYNLFPYIPVEIYHILGIMLLLVILLRILGR